MYPLQAPRGQAKEPFGRETNGGISLSRLQHAFSDSWGVGTDRKMHMRTLPTHTRRSGNVLITTVLVLPVFFALMLLVVDFARVQTAKSQLYDGSEGMARYAVTGLVDGTAVAKAQAVASELTLD